MENVQNKKNRVEQESEANFGWLGFLNSRGGQRTHMRMAELCLYTRNRTGTFLRSMTRARRNAIISRVSESVSTRHAAAKEKEKMQRSKQHRLGEQAADRDKQQKREQNFGKRCALPGAHSVENRQYLVISHFSSHC